MVSATTSPELSFQAVADPARRAVLDALRAGERSVNELLARVCEAVKPMSQPALSQHLRVLREARLVEVRKDGRRRLYGLRAEPLREVADWVATYDAFWEERLDALGGHLGRVAKGGDRGA
ncbi:MAG: metalloregulator ArsR/SmtB family transcription factor [Planctomycetota bacterium]